LRRAIIEKAQLEASASASLSVSTPTWFLSSVGTGLKRYDRTKYKYREIMGKFSGLRLRFSMSEVMRFAYLISTSLQTMTIFLFFIFLKLNCGICVLGFTGAGVRLGYFSAVGHLERTFSSFDDPYLQEWHVI